MCFNRILYFINGKAIMKLLSDMALFVEVAKTMSLKKTSEITGVPNSTLSRRMTELEKTVGLRLMQRTTRQIQLTEEGKIYFERCKKIIEEAELAHRELNNMIEEPSGILRASFPVDFAIKFLVPLMIEFSKKYPKVIFDIDVNARKVDMIAENYDIVIRIGNLPDSNLVARHLTTLSTHLYASPKYLEQYGIPKNPEDLEFHECLNIFKSNEWLLTSKESKKKIAVQSKFTVNNVGMVSQLAVYDAGIILLPQHIVQDSLDSNQLVPILIDWQGPPFFVYAITTTRLLPAKTRCFLDFIKEKFDSKI